MYGCNVALMMMHYDGPASQTRLLTSSEVHKTFCTLWHTDTSDKEVSPGIVKSLQTFVASTNNQTTGLISDWWATWARLTISPPHLISWNCCGESLTYPYLWLYILAVAIEEIMRIMRLVTLRLLSAHLDLLIFIIQTGKCVFNIDLCLMFEKVATLDFHRLGKVP